MTRRNDKRNNRRIHRRNNQPELPPFAQMLFGAILGKGAEMFADTLMKNAKEKTEETPDIHAEGISNQDVTNINNGKASPTKCTIPTDGTAVELPIPSNLQVFISEDGKPMIRKKTEGDEKPTDAAEGKPITYDDVLKKLFLNKTASWIGSSKIYTAMIWIGNYNDQNNCTTEAQARRTLAYNKLMNIAKYLNGDWKPDFDGHKKNWNICKEGDDYLALWTDYTENCSVYFKSEEAAYKAVRLMGEDSLNDLFSTDW